MDSRLAAVVDCPRDSFMSAELGELGWIPGSAQLAESLTKRKTVGVARAHGSSRRRYVSYTALCELSRTLLAAHRIWRGRVKNSPLCSLASTSRSTDRCCATCNMWLHLLPFPGSPKRPRSGLCASSANAHICSPRRHRVSEISRPKDFRRQRTCFGCFIAFPHYPGNANFGAKFL
jgi:hypothetical protein